MPVSIVTLKSPHDSLQTNVTVVRGTHRAHYRRKPKSNKHANCRDLGRIGGISSKTRLPFSIGEPIPGKEGTSAGVSPVLEGHRCPGAKYAEEVGYPSRVSGACPERSRRKGEGRPFRGRKGQVFPTCEPRKGHFESMKAKGKWCPFQKAKSIILSIDYREIGNERQEPPEPGALTTGLSPG
jgi:hypothetical protein